MPFTAQELVNVANATIDFHERKQPDSQIKQSRPLLDDLMRGKRAFPGGTEYITGPVKGVYSSEFVGYEHDDEQPYVNPANIKRYQAKWYELGAGIQFTGTELKKNGISVVDTTTGERVSRHSQRELIALVDLVEDKMEDLTEGPMRSLQNICWQDGTQDSKVFPGVTSFITTTPTTGTTFGIDRVSNPWWRNRATLNISATTPSDLNITNTLQKEVRQLRRYGAPRHKMYAGSDFLDAWEKEIRSKGNFTLDGWAKQGSIDASMADLALKGILCQYDPHLDDLGLQKHMFLLDLASIILRPMEGEEFKDHNPARPPEKYVYYRARTWTGALVAKQLNTSGRYSIA